MNAPSPIPKGLHHSAQVCPVRGTAERIRELPAIRRSADIPVGPCAPTQTCRQECRRSFRQLANAPGTTLGHRHHHSFQPQGGCIILAPAGGCNPVGVDGLRGRFPRVASRPRQPWAGCLSPVGANATFRLRPVGANPAARPRLARTPQRRIVVELDAEAAQIGVVRSLIPPFEAKIQRVLDRVWGTV